MSVLLTGRTFHFSFSLYVAGMFVKFQSFIEHHRKIFEVVDFPYAA